MNNKIKKNVIGLIVAATTILSVSPVYAANISDIQTSGITDEQKIAINETKSLQNIPSEVIGLLNDKGGKIDFKDNVSTLDGRVAEGIYWQGGDKDNSIEILKKDSIDSMSYNLSHELGHFIYFNTERTDEENNVLLNYCNKLKAGDVSGTMCIEEAFAHGYSSYVSDDGYYLSDEEKELFDLAEEKIKDQYYENHPDLISQRVREDKLPPDYENMPTWKLASYGPEIFRMYGGYNR